MYMKYMFIISARIHIRPDNSEIQSDLSKTYLSDVRYFHFEPLFGFTKQFIMFALNKRCVCQAL